MTVCRPKLAHIEKYGGSYPIGAAISWYWRRGIRKLKTETED
jgi:hypothetical protein